MDPFTGTEGVAGLHIGCWVLLWHQGDLIWGAADVHQNIQTASAGMQGHFEAAIADYTQALRIDPSHTRTLYNRASCYEKLQRLDEALTDYSTAITMEEGSARAFFTRQDPAASVCGNLSRADVIMRLPAAEA